MSSELRRRIEVRGEVSPRAWPDGRELLHAECLIEGADPRIEVTARFAQTIRRQIHDPDGNPVESLLAAGRRYDSGEELEEHEVTLAELPDRTAELRRAGRRSAELRERGAAAGTIAWSWEPLHATVEAWVDEISPGLRRVRVELANRLESDAGPADRNRLRTLHGAICSCTAPTAPSSPSPSHPLNCASRRPNAATRASGPSRSARPATAARCWQPRCASTTTPTSPPAPASASPGSDSAEQHPARPALR